MTTDILVVSDIHANYPALEAVAGECGAEGFDRIINLGDTTVYATFPNETIDWLREHGALSILGNTDRKVLKLLRGKEMKKPRMEQKRVMYTWTAASLTPANRSILAEMKKKERMECEGFRIGLFHGSPDRDNEFLFADTPEERFRELARSADCDIVLVGHSHSPFHKVIEGVHFVNSGSVGRMFDGSPAASYATLSLEPGSVRVGLFRCTYDLERVVRGLRDNGLPMIYETMYRAGRKLN